MRIHARYELMCYALLCFALLHCAMPTKYELSYMINVRDIKLYDVKRVNSQLTNVLCPPKFSFSSSFSEKLFQRSAMK